MRTYFKSGSWNALCDVCGFKYKSDELKKRWDGLMVCAKDFEVRHPQDLIRIPEDNPSIPWSRPVPPDTFISVISALTTEEGTDLDYAIPTELGILIFTES